MLEFVKLGVRFFCDFLGIILDPEALTFQHCFRGNTQDRYLVIMMIELTALLDGSLILENKISHLYRDHTQPYKSNLNILATLKSECLFNIIHNKLAVVLLFK